MKQAGAVELNYDTRNNLINCQKIVSYDFNIPYNCFIHFSSARIKHFFNLGIHPLLLLLMKSLWICWFWEKEGLNWCLLQVLMTFMNKKSIPIAKLKPI